MLRLPDSILGHVVSFVVSNNHPDRWDTNPKRDPKTAIQNLKSTSKSMREMVTWEIKQRKRVATAAFHDIFDTLLNTEEIKKLGMERRRRQFKNHQTRDSFHIKKGTDAFDFRIDGYLLADYTIMVMLEHSLSFHSLIDIQPHPNGLITMCVYDDFRQVAFNRRTLLKTVVEWLIASNIPT